MFPALRYAFLSATLPHRGSGQLPRLPKLCPDIMKPQQLRAKLKEYHLPTHGSRQALMTRLKEYHLQYNAQRDSYNPKSGTLYVYVSQSVSGRVLK